MRHGTRRHHEERGRGHSHDQGRGSHDQVRRCHGGRRGGHGRGGDRMERGALRFILLDVLRDAPRHGYEIIKSLEERTHGQYAPSPGTVYPTLQYLDDLGFVRAKQEGDRRVYEITDAGRAELETQAERVSAFWSRFESQTPSESSLHEVGFLKDELEDLARTVWSGLRELIGRNDRETIRSIRQAVERCQNEIRDLIAGGSSAAGSPDRAE